MILRSAWFMDCNIVKKKGDRRFYNIVKEPRRQNRMKYKPIQAPPIAKHDKSSMLKMQWFIEL